MKVLITGFEPFGGEKLNPSYEAIKSLPSEIFGIELVKREVPVEYKGAISFVIDEMNKLSPDIVIMIGQAGGRASISVERVAINVVDSEMPDNSKKLVKGEPVVKEGPVGYFSTLPIYEIVKRLRRNGIPSYISNTAGTFVCNSLFYGVMHEISRKNLKIMAGFVHVPYSSSQVLKRPNVPSMSIENITKGIKEIVGVSAEKYRERGTKE